MIESTSVIVFLTDSVGVYSLPIVVGARLIPIAAIAIPRATIPEARCVCMASLPCYMVKTILTAAVRLVEACTNSSPLIGHLHATENRHNDDSLTGLSMCP